MFYRDVKGRLAKNGRDPEDLKILPWSVVIVKLLEYQHKWPISCRNHFKNDAADGFNITVPTFPQG